MRTPGWMVLVVVLSAALEARAHMPYLSDGSYDGPATAFAIEDVDVSMVLYHPVTCESLQLWLTFEADAGHPLVAQLAVPKLTRLEGFRPSLALLGPGLPPAPDGLPFPVPEGLGARVYETTDVEPALFYEPFSRTDSWIYVKIDEDPLPAAGRHYLVAWSPTRATGKLWVTVGVLEDFSDITSSDELMELIDGVKLFHEAAGEADVEETVCPEAPAVVEPGPDAGGADASEHAHEDGHAHGDEDALAGDAADVAVDSPGGKDAGGGCAAAPTSGPGTAWPVAAFALLAAAATALRRRTPLASRR